MPALLPLLPIPLLFVAGVVLRRRGVLDGAFGDRALAWVVNLALPALILGSVPALDLSRDLLWLPGLAMATDLLVGVAALAVGLALGLSSQRLGVFVIGPMIMNLAAVYPFVLLGWGEQAFALLVLFDFGNAFLTLTLTYGLAAWFGDHGGGPAAAVRALVAFPPFAALALALGMNLTQSPLPANLADGLMILGRWLLLLVPLALGLHFQLARVQVPALLLAMGLRVGLGLLLGLAWVAGLGLGGAPAAVVLIGVLAPVGFNTLVYAARVGLDRSFAASLASLSLLLGMLYLPLAVLWLRPAGP